MISGMSVIMSAAPTFASPVKSSPRLPLCLRFPPFHVPPLEPWPDADVALVRGGERHARPANGLGLAPGRRVDADRRRRDVGRELPGLTALAVGDDARDLVVELLRHVRRPDVRRLEH